MINWMFYPQNFPIQKHMKELIRAFENKQEESHKYRLTVAFMFTRLVLLVGFMVGMGFLYYPGNVHAFNIIAIAGGYFIVEIAFIVLHLRKRNDL